MERWPTIGHGTHAQLVGSRVQPTHAEDAWNHVGERGVLVGQLPEDRPQGELLADALPTTSGINSPRATCTLHTRQRRPALRVILSLLCARLATVLAGLLGERRKPDTHQLAQDGVLVDVGAP